MARASSIIAASAVILCQSHAACQTPNKKVVDRRIVELAERNAKTIALIRTADVKVEVKLENVDPKSISYRGNHRHLRWTKRGNVERLVVNRVKPLGGAPDDPVFQQVSAVHELDHSESTYRFFEHITPPEGSLGPSDKAYEAPLSRWRPHFEIHRIFCQRFSSSPRDDESRSLKEMIGEWPSEFRDTAEVDGAKCDVVRVTQPGGPPIDFYLDRQLGAVVRKTVEHREHGQTVRKVVKFYRGEKGEVLPLECESFFQPNKTTENSTLRVMRIRVTDFSINEDVAESDVRIRFPVATTVRIYGVPLGFRVPQQETGLGIVGEDGQIIRRIEKNSKEWQRYFESGQLPDH